MMSDEELIAQLRSMHWCVTTLENGVGVSNSTVAAEAADHIKELEKALENMQREYDKRGDRIDELKGQLKTVLEREAATHARHDARIEELDAKLAKAVDALRNVVEEYDLFRKDEYERGMSPLDDEIYDARATLAELKGEQQ